MINTSMKGGLRKAKVFIGSSSEAVDVAEAIHQNLERDAEITIWRHANSALSSRSILETLFKSLDASEFGIFVLTPDDLATVRDLTLLAPRDNVVLELGMFLGRLGPDRVFFITPAAPPALHLPVDLSGILHGTYDAGRADGNLTAALGPTCNRIRQQLRSPSRPRTVLSDKAEIDEVWRQLLSHANQQVRVLAGDISWANRDIELLRNAIERGVHFDVLCRQPSMHVAPKQNLGLLLEAGARVRFFDASHHTSVRGLIVDSVQDQTGVAFQVKKSPRGNLLGPPGQPGDANLYVYSASYYSGEDHKNEIRIMRDLFDSLFAATPEACVLSALDLSMDRLGSILSGSGVAQYRNLKADQVQYITVAKDQLWASCKYAKVQKLRGIEGLVHAFECQGIPAFKPCRFGRSSRQSLLLPPIVERHAKGYVVVDGTHRLFQHFNVNAASTAHCLCLTVGEPLPSTPVPFEDVTVVPSKPARTRSFNNYAPNRFRNMKSLDAWLTSDQVLSALSDRTA